MCDYSLQSLKSVDASLGDKLLTHNFGTSTSGFVKCDSEGEPVIGVAVCVRPGTELAFSAPIQTIWAKSPSGAVFLVNTTHKHSVAVFRQVDKDNPKRHHDALELPNGQIVMLTWLASGQKASVLQLPATPKNEQEKLEQERVAYSG